MDERECIVGKMSIIGDDSEIGIQVDWLCAGYEGSDVIVIFTNKQVAMEALRDNGFTDEEIDSFIYADYEIFDKDGVIEEV